MSSLIRYEFARSAVRAVCSAPSVPWIRPSHSNLFKFEASKSLATVTPEPGTQAQCRRPPAAAPRRGRPGQGLGPSLQVPVSHASASLALQPQCQRRSVELGPGLGDAGAGDSPLTGQGVRPPCAGSLPGSGPGSVRVGATAGGSSLGLPGTQTPLRGPSLTACIGSVRGAPAQPESGHRAGAARFRSGIK